jgi:hypothetical protein
MNFTQQMHGMKNKYFVCYSICSCSNSSYSKKSGHAGNINEVLFHMTWWYTRKTELKHGVKNSTPKRQPIDTVYTRDVWFRTNDPSGMDSFEVSADQRRKKNS